MVFGPHVVFVRCDRLKMFWIDATADFAEVI
jgi:hypothetical protein